MNGRYLGRLSHSDPLYAHIEGHIAPQLGFDSPGADYRVFKFNCSQAVYLYEERLGAYSTHRDQSFQPIVITHSASS
jgi:hypothetical protein